jgi:adenosylcobinamide-phosphate synthase
VWFDTMGHAFHLPAPLILLALALDAVFGDPAWMPHPVRLIGAMIAGGEEILWSGFARRDLRNGAILAATIVVISTACVWALISVADLIAYPFGAMTAVAIAWTTLALRGLDHAAADVANALISNDLNKARQAIRALVGRDPAALDRVGLIRAAVESVAENCSDGVIAPMFFLFVGGPVAAIAYKAINTLDSMIGYLDDRYFYFGRCAARLDDAANLVPARLTALSLMGAAVIVSKRAGQAYATCRNSARLHRSPNAGYPEATMAGALGIQLGGDAVYAGEIEHRAVLGKADREPAVADIVSARTMMRLASIIAFCALASARFLLLSIVR